MKGTMQKEEANGEDVQKGEAVPFRMKAEPPNIKYDLPKKEAKQEPSQGKIKTDAEGMDRAYAQGDTYIEDNKMFVAGSHTARDWWDDFTKIPQWQYVPPGLFDFVDLMNSEPGKLIFGTGDLRQAERYKAGREALLSHEKVDLGEGHSLGGSVVLQLQKDFPDRLKKRSRMGHRCGIRLAGKKRGRTRKRFAIQQQRGYSEYL